MAKGPSYVCTACGAVHARWAGRCDACGAWNTIEVEAPRAATPGAKGRSRGRANAVPLVGLGAEEAPPPRAVLGLGELDRVLGGGLVPGSAILLGGDPGIGKSTLLLQAAAASARAGRRTVYVSGEEATAQVRMRAQRLGLAGADVALAAATGLREILAMLDAERPAFAIVDSIQTMWLDTVESAAGSVAQVRAAAHELTAFAKKHGTTIVLVGHVTKDGQIAGPRVVEHMVDTVLYFEGERGHPFRILRSVKNRYGPAGEIGVFEMTGAGLTEVANPSALFLSDRDGAQPGSAVFAGVEGTRPLLVEIQALVAPAPHGTPRRTVVGWDGGRLAMLLAVLESRCGVPFAGLDVYVSVAGGLRVTEPAADLAVACALLSAREDAALPAGTVAFGEVALSGALRPAAQSGTRLKEAGKLGFSEALTPKGATESAPEGVTVRAMADLPALAGEVFGAG